jgi:hypothetical protein
VQVFINFYFFVLSSLPKIKEKTEMKERNNQSINEHINGGTEGNQKAEIHKE